MHIFLVREFLKSNPDAKSEDDQKIEYEDQDISIISDSSENTSQVFNQGLSFNEENKIKSFLIIPFSR